MNWRAGSGRFLGSQTCKGPPWFVSLSEKSLPWPRAQTGAARHELDFETVVGVGVDRVRGAGWTMTLKIGGVCAADLHQWAAGQAWSAARTGIPQS